MRPNVLLLVLDTVRARNTSLHGHLNPTTPFLSEFASTQATWYEQARAPAARSLDSHVSILTGLHVAEHEVTKAGDKLAAGHTIFETLHDEHDYATGVFSENSWLTDVDSGIKDAFETVEGPRNVPFPDAIDPTSFVVEHGQGQYRAFLKACAASDQPLKSFLNGLSIKLAADYPRLLPTSRTNTPAQVYSNLFLDWSDAQNRPWAACLNLMDAHHPYEPDEAFDAWGGEELRTLQEKIEDVKWEFNGGHRPWWQRNALEGLYDGAIRQLDAEVERIISTLEARSELDNTLVVITSDHGEGFGEQSELHPEKRVASHSDSSHEVLLHVPLVVKFPGQTTQKVVHEPATLTNFPATVQRVLDDDDEPEAAFTRPDGVVATVHGLDDPVRKRASAYCDDLSAFLGESKVVYKTADGSVKKHVVWESANDSKTETLICRDAQVSYPVAGENTRSAVERAFDDIVPMPVKQAGQSVSELDDTSYQRLKDLGYV